jgi:hypothetical protein
MGNEGLGTGDGLLVGLGCSSEASDGVAGSSEVFGVEDSGCRGVVGCSCTGDGDRDEGLGIVVRHVLPALGGADLGSRGRNLQLQIEHAPDGNLTT